MRHLLCLTIFITDFLNLADAKPPASLRMVHYLFRHGDRSPMKSYPGDPNPPNVTWPKGFGQLSTTGMQQHYKLGRLFRKRYDGFISPIYYNKEIYVQSTDVDRTLMSAYSHLAGLYPPQGEDIWNGTIPWQPIPVHTLSSMYDYILQCWNCPRRDILTNKAYHLPYFQKIEEENKDFVAKVSKFVGVKYDLRNISDLADVVYIEHLKKLPLDEFFTDSVIKHLSYIEMIRFKAEAYTTELQRILGGGGPLVKDVIQRCQRKIDGTLKPDLKLYIYSAHDSTVSAFLNSIKAFNDKSPPYTATVIMELHEVSGQYYLQFLYKNETDREPYDLIVPGCSKKCPFQKFVELTKPIIPVDVKRECELPAIFDGAAAQQVQIIIFASIAGISTVIVILQVAVITLMSKRNDQILYSRVDLNM